MSASHVHIYEVKRFQLHLLATFEIKRLGAPFEINFKLRPSFVF